MGKNYTGIALDSQPVGTVGIIQCPRQSEFHSSKVGHRTHKNNYKNIPKLRKG